MPNKRSPKRLDLSVFGEFKASHSLQGFETPHFHLWKASVDFAVELPIEGDRLIDLVFLQSVLSKIFRPLEGKYLNEVFPFSPTSENLAQWVWSEITAVLPEAPLAEVSITLCDLEGHATGRARLKG